MEIWLFFDEGGAHMSDRYQSKYIHYIYIYIYMYTFVNDIRNVFKLNIPIQKKICKLAFAFLFTYFTILFIRFLDRYRFIDSFLV